MQWAIYLSLQLMFAVQGIKESEEFTFDALYFSGIMGLISLTLGQMKVHGQTV